jgi:uncharacterized protein (DUF983 family)
MTTPPAPVPNTAILLPESYRFAALRGLRGHCPRCDRTRLFRAWLKPVDRCAACAQDWSLQRADDFPAYISIFVTGHLMAPLVIMLIGDLGLSAWATLAIVLPLACVLMLGLLQPAKGAVLATMWWTGMGGFTKERRLGHPDGADRP